MGVSERKRTNYSAEKNRSLLQKYQAQEAEEYELSEKSRRRRIQGGKSGDSGRKQKKSQLSRNNYLTESMMNQSYQTMQTDGQSSF